MVKPCYLDYRRVCCLNEMKKTESNSKIITS
jgi:hypothetical protein